MLFKFVDMNLITLAVGHEHFGMEVMKKVFYPGILIYVRCIIHMLWPVTYLFVMADELINFTGHPC